MKKILIYLSFILIGISGCKKVDIDDVPSGDPVFTVEAMLDNSSLNLVAGDDDFYMYTEHSRDNFDVVTMTGKFAKDNNCVSECEESLSFSIRSNYSNAIGDFNIDEAISPSFNYGYFSNDNPVIQGYHYSFEGDLIDSIFGTFADSFVWIITRDSSVFVETGKFLNFNYFGNTEMEVRLDVMSQNGNCTSYIRKNIPVGINDDCNLFIEVMPVPGSNFQEFSFIPQLGNMGQGVDFYWNGNLIPADTFLFDSLFTLPNNGLVELIASNNECSVEMGICIDQQSAGAIPTGISFPEISYSITDTTMTTNLNEQFSTVIIEYSDSTGIYSSLFNDNDSATFDIVNIEEYEDNEHGEKTKKLTVNYDCILQKEGSNETKSISGTAVIGVAYPE